MNFGKRYVKIWKNKYIPSWDIFFENFVIQWVTFNKPVEFIKTHSNNVKGGFLKNEYLQNYMSQTG